MAVVAKMVDGVIQLHPQSAEDGPLADYLLKAIREVRNLAQSADEATVKKAGLTGLALVRKSQEDRLKVLNDQAEVWEERSRDWSLVKDIRDINADRGRQAREEARKIAQELGE